jgi:trk system potassium uptake protein TrkH
MNLRLVFRAISALLVVIALAIGSSMAVAWLMGDPHAVIVKLGVCFGVTLATAGAGLLLTGQGGHFRFREGFAIVTLGWIVASIFGALPFVLVSQMHWYDAFFETMSGFTTTGASVLDNTLVLMDGNTLKQGIADLPAGLLYWRSLTHWLGGMGIVVLSLAIMPSLGLGAHQLYLAEVPGPTEDQLTPRIADSAKILWGVYVLLSLVETGLLMLGGMSLFEAWCHTCGTMATGGFSTSQASVAGFDSAYIDYVISLFMFLAGANFVLHFRALRGKPLSYWRDEEFRFYLMVTVLATLTIAVSVVGGSVTTTAGKEITNIGFQEAIRYSFFQVTSILTTTGFATADFNLWPAYCTLLLVLLMFIGGCAGSTGGGMKNSRILLVLKYSLSQVERCFFRRSISNVRLSGQRISEDVLHKTLTFACIFVGFFVAFSLALCMLGVDDITTACTASIAALGNIGPGLVKVGPTCTYAWMGPSAKILLSFAMLLGRLELYTVLVLFMPSFYK